MADTLSLTFNVSSAPTTVNLPIYGSGLAVSIDWGDGNTDSSLSHVYATNASFTAVVTVTAGSVNQFGSYGTLGIEILTTVATSNNATWGLPGVTSFSQAFAAAPLLTSVPTNIPSSVTNLNSMFSNATIFNQDISSWDVSGVTNMGGIFNGCIFNQNISSWNVSNVTDMSSMFRYNNAFNQDISSWNVSSVTNMVEMFQNAVSFNNGAVGNVGGKPLTWTAGTGTSNVTNMGNMFYYAAAFNQDISSWNVSSVTNMGNMFNNATIFNNGSPTNDSANPLTWSAGTGTSNVTDMNYMLAFTSFNQNISGWNVGNVTNMSGIFQTTPFNQDVSSWDVSKVTNMGQTFCNCQQYNQDISSWNVSSVTNMYNMFQNAVRFNNGAVGNVGGKPLTWTTGTGTRNVTDMGRMFSDAYAFNQNISSWDFSNVTNMNEMFARTAIFNQDISSWNISVVTNMGDMFTSSSQFNNGSLTNDGLHPISWGNKTSSVTNMGNMFGGAAAFNQDISGWNVSSVTNMGSMFGFAREFNNGSPTNDGLHPLTWTTGTGTSNVTNMGYMFWGVTKFNQNVSSWNVSSVTNMNRLFSGVGGGAVFNNGSITDDSANPITWTAGTGTSNVTDMGLMFESQNNFNQNISSWNVSKVTNMTQMFAGNTKFNKNISGWDVSKVTDMFFMFGGARAFNQNISGWDVSKVTDMTNMFASAVAFNQDISSWNVSKVLTMSSMFDSATAFNKNIRSWKVQASINLSNMFNGAGAFQTAFYPTTPGYITDPTTPLYTFFTPITLTLTFSNTPGSVTLPISGTSVLVSVDWGDSTIDTSLSHTYSGAGPYDAVILITNGSVTSFGSAAWTGVNKLTAVATADLSTWGLGSSVTSFANAFDGATILTSVPSNIPSSVTDTSSMFNAATSFNQNISGWDVSRVTNMSSMFQGAALFNQDISGWDVSDVTNMSSMFNAATSFNQDISLWSVGSVTDMTSMFNGASIFNQNIRPWIVSAGTTLTNIFQNATAFQAAFYPTTPGYNASTGGNATPLYTFFEPSALTLTFSNTPGSVTLPISGTSVAVSVDWGDSTIDTSLSHTYSGAGPYDAKIIITSGTVTTFGSDNWTGVAKLTAASTNNISRWGLGPSVTSFANSFKGAVLLTSVPSNIPSNVTNLQSMFQGATTFNQNISVWNLSNVTNVQSMFQGATNFNQNIGVWDVTNVTNMISMFNGATTFNKKIRVWKVGAGTTLTNMFSGATAFQVAFYPTTPGYNAFSGGNATPLYNFFNLDPYPCFLEGTQILCFKNNKEVYRPVESLRKGDLVKTIYNGYLPIHMIGTSPMYNPDNDDRFSSRLYRCSKENYPGLFEDLYITGCHSILVPKITYKQAQKTIASLGRLFVTDKHCRLMAWVDEKSEPYKMAGIYNIYHIALENNDYYMNYGIYANGLLVESCSKRYLTEISNMRILGEEDTSLTEGVSAEENVFHKMPRLVDIC